MATEQEYWNRLRRAAIACLSTSLRHGSPAMLDSLCELERAVYDGMTETFAPVAPDPGLREEIDWRDVIARVVEPMLNEPNQAARHMDSYTVADAVLSVLAERGGR